MRWTLWAVMLASLLWTLPLWAHGGHEAPPSGLMSTPPPPGGAAEGEDMYGLNAGEEDAGSMYGMESPGEESPDSEPGLGRSGLLDEALPELTPEAAPAAGAPSEHSGGKHDQHIAPAQHTLVSTDAKGYGVALALTLLSGLAFGVWSLVRPFE